MRRSLSFDEVLEAISTETSSLLTRVVRAAAASGMPIYLVGGPVRDLLLDLLAEFGLGLMHCVS